MPKTKSQAVLCIGGAGEHSGGLKGGGEAMDGGFGEAQSPRQIGDAEWVGLRAEEVQNGRRALECLYG